MAIKYLVFGTGLLGNTFRIVLPTASVVLSRDLCDITKKDDIKAALDYYNPRIVINAAGIVPKNSSADSEEMFKVNAFAPHYIADLCYRKRRFVHISTDSVFSGERGKYTERFDPDATGLYGMSKILGEPNIGLVIRGSFVGLPDPKGHGLFSWASAQEEVVGYDRVFWNGLTTVEFIRKTLELIDDGAEGIRHIYSYTVSKYELLKCAKEVFEWDTYIHKETDCVEECHQTNKTLNSIYATGFVAKPIKRQLKELKNVCF